MRDVATIGWSERDLGRRSGRSHSNVNRCFKGYASITSEEADWIAMAADFFLTHPYPRQKPLVFSDVDGLVEPSLALGDVAGIEACEVSTVASVSR